MECVRGEPLSRCEGYLKHPPASRGSESITPLHTRKEDISCFVGSRGHQRSPSEGLDGQTG
jgi:hypothetical protein